MIIYIIAALLIAGSAFLFVQYRRIKQKILNTQLKLTDLKTELEASEYQVKENYRLASDIENDIQDLIRKKTELFAEKDGLNKEIALLCANIKSKQEYLNSNLAEMEELQKTQREQLEVNLAELEKSEREKLAMILSKAKIECDEKLNILLENTDKQIAECEKKTKEAKDIYFSTLEVLQNLKESKDDTQATIEISASERSDIDFLLNTVVEKIRKPDVLYKLIWSEYIQKPTNRMLDYILPSKDCSGIYKITNINNGKCYIGRSTSVRKRLTDHIKSAIGISTIADQHIHEVMRNEGIWNFRFELIEACEKSDLGSREKYYIDFFNSSNQKYGYNAVGGSEYKE